MVGFACHELSHSETQAHSFPILGCYDCSTKTCLSKSKSVSRQIRAV